MKSTKTIMNNMKKEKKAKENQSQTLIRAAIDRYGVEDMLNRFFYVANYKETDEAIKWLADNQEDELREHMELHNNIIILKVESMDKKTKIADFINSEIFPHYNEQPTFFN